MAPKKKSGSKKSPPTPRVNTSDTPGDNAQSGKSPTKPTTPPPAVPSKSTMNGSTSASPSKSKQEPSSSKSSTNAGDEVKSNGRADPSDDPEELKEQGNFYFKEKEYDIAIDLYTQAISHRPDPTYYTNRAAAYMSQKKYVLARDDCQTAVSLQRETPSAKTYARLAKCHFALGDASAALVAVQQALQLDPGNTGALSTRTQAEQMQTHLDRCQTSRERKDWGQARWALEKAMSACEGNFPIQWRVWRVEIDIARKNWDEATSSAVTALRLEPKSPDVLTVRGLVLFLTNQINPCLEHLKTALRLDPEFSQARTLLRKVKDVERVKEEGNQHFKGSRYTQAVEKYSETLEIIGQNEEEGCGGYIRAILLSNRATTLHKLKKHEDALQDTEASLELMPSSFKALRTQARIRLALEQYEEAVRDFKRAQEVISMEGNLAEEKAILDEIRQAEVQLKRSKTKDYYKILGVSREATETEIKKAYRKESLLHHPDKGGDEEKFKLVVEANTVLSDPHRRARYDRGEDEDGSMDSGMGGMGGMGGMDINDLLAAMGGHPFEAAPLLSDSNGHAGAQSNDEDRHSGVLSGIAAATHEPLSTLSKVLLGACLVLLLTSSVFIGLFAGAEHRLRTGDGAPRSTITSVSTVYATRTATQTKTATVTSVPTKTPEPLPCVTSECIQLSASILASIDTTQDPCNDFYEYANGGWLRENPLPAAKASFGQFNQLAQKNVRIIRDIVEREIPANTSSADARSLTKLHNLYKSCMDEKTLESLGQEPLLNFTRIVRRLFNGHIMEGQGLGMDFNQVVYEPLEDKVVTKAGLTAAVSFLHSKEVPVFFWFDIDGDAAVDPDFMTLQFSQAGLGLPSKEYYEEDAVVSLYTKTVARVLEAVDELPSKSTSPDQRGRNQSKFWPPIPWPPWGGGDDSPKENKTARAARLSEAVIDFEKKLAKASLDLDTLYGNPFYTYNPFTFDNFTKALPEIDFPAYLSSYAPRSFPEKVIVSYPPYLHSLSRLLGETEAEVLEAYMVSRISLSLAGYLGSNTEVWKANRALDELLKGLKKGAVDDRDEWCLQRVESALGFAAGRFFVQETFGGNSQLKAAKVIDDIITSFKASLPRLGWMDKKSAQAASEKATAMRVKVGYPFYPNTTDDRSIASYYRLVDPDPARFLDNMVAARVSDQVKKWLTLGKMRNKDSWEMYPSTVNAYFNPPANEIVFPAGILRPPFFSQSWPAYLSYGSFGAVAAHELTHAFDSNGRMYNQRGKLEVWWTNSTSQHFDERKECIAEQYSKYTVDDGKGGVVHVNGNLTSGENIGDAGVVYAWKAWKAQEAEGLQEGTEYILPGLQHFTKEQLFFISYGRIWGRNMKPAAAVQQVRTDPHSPARYRVQGTLSNLPEFAKAWGCPKGSAMNPAKRCSLWV